MIDKYDDIINLPRHISKTRPPMEIKDRAAQFLPFAALTGHDAAIKETSRLTEGKVELDEYIKEVLNYKLQILAEKIKEGPKIKITYFVPDEKKDGGVYVESNGRVKKIDKYKMVINMTDGTLIPIDDIKSIEGEIF